MPARRRPVVRFRTAAAAGNRQALAQVVATWSRGGGALPARLGLPPQQFRRLMAHHFPDRRPRPVSRPASRADARRAEEAADLRRLLLGARAGRSRAEVWIADILCAACLAPDHLWQDLGLWDRSELSALFARNFPRLYAGNRFDMKWKKFLYKQLCLAGGTVVCRAPSCRECADYDACFGPET